MVESAVVDETKRRRARRTWPQRLLLVTSTFVAIACFAAAGVFALVRQKASELPTYDIASVGREQKGIESPRNILIVGTDSSVGIDKHEKIAQGRNSFEHLADVIMILRVDPQANKVSLMSIPRDSWVPVAPRWNKTKINSAYGGSGGPDNLIATIKHNFGIPIDNFLEVDWAGFRKVVEVLGGVPVYLDHPISDRTTGLWLIQTGCVVIDPSQALAYSRSRHLRWQEGSTYVKSAKWRTDPTGDLGRISRQQAFVKRAAQRAIDQGLRNPSTAYGLVNAGLGAVKVDQKLSVGQVVGLIGLFRTFAVESLTSQQVPTATGGSASTVSSQDILWDQAEPLLNGFRGVRNPGAVVASDVIVDVAPDAPGAATTAGALNSAGFLAGSDDASVAANRTGSTVIRFGPDGAEAARVLASHLDGSVTYEFVRTLPGRRLELAFGTTAPSVRSTPSDIASVPMPTVPATTQPGRSTTTQPGRSTTTVATGIPPTVPMGGNTTTTSIVSGGPTTTTVVGVVPINAEASSKCGA